MPRAKPMFAEKRSSEVKWLRDQWKWKCCNRISTEISVTTSWIWWSMLEIAEARKISTSAEEIRESGGRKSHTGSIEKWTGLINYSILKIVWFLKRYGFNINETLLDCLTWIYEISSSENQSNDPSLVGSKMDPLRWIPLHLLVMWNACGQV